MGHVVLRASNVGADTLVRTILVILIGRLTIVGLRLRLAPGVVTAIVGGALVLRMVSVNVAARPFGATGQTEINHVWVVVVGTGEVGLWGISMQDDVDQFHDVRDGYNPIAVQIASWRSLCIARECHESQYEGEECLFHKNIVFVDVGLTIRIQKYTLGVRNPTG